MIRSLLNTYYHNKFQVDIVVSISCIIAVIILFSGVIFPKYQETNERISTYNTNKQDLTMLQNKVRQVQEFDISSLRSSLTKLNAIVPSEQDIVSVMQTLDSITLSNNVQMSALHFNATNLASASAKAKSLSLSGLAFPISIIGPDEGVVNVIRDLQRSAPLFTVTSLQLMYSQDGISQATISLVSHVIPLPKFSLSSVNPFVLLTEKQKKLLVNIDEYSSKPFIDLEMLEATGSPIIRKNIFTE